MNVLFFARARDLAGLDRLAVELPAGATVAELRRHLAGRFPRLAGLLQRCAVAVDGEFADDATPIPSSAEVALLPPVSGG